MTWRDFPNLTRQGQLDYLTMKDGTRVRVACWPSMAKSRGIIVLVTGHREYMEKYYAFISDFLDRGFAVYTLDNRGQGLSDRLGPNRLKSYGENFDHFASDLDELISKKARTDPRAGELPFILIGHSMGGNICLRYLHDYPRTFDKAILTSPMIGMNKGPAFLKGPTRVFIRMACRWGFRNSFALGQGSGYSKAYGLISRKILTHDKEIYNQEVEIIAANPDLYVDGATYGWLDAALTSNAKIKEPGFMAALTLPILIALAGDERLVDNTASRAVLSNLDNVHLVTIPGSRHEIYRESPQYQDQLWQEIDRFLGVE